MTGFGTRGAGIDGWDVGPAREFFYFFSAYPFFIKEKTVVNDNHTEFFYWPSS